MHFLFHGEYQLKSREQLQNTINALKKKGLEIIRLEGDTLTVESIKQSTSGMSLFGVSQAIVIENLFSRPKSQVQAKILEFLKTYTGETPLIFWDRKVVGKILQRSLPPETTVKEFKIPALIFKLVEQISPKNKGEALKLFDQVLLTEVPEIIFAMMVRQMRMLVLASGGEKLPGPSWMTGKVYHQAEEFDPEILLEKYKQLYFIDKSIKTGSNITNLSWLIRDWMLEL